ncbi:hypothetical protein [Nitrospirillum sp. BR 11828]|uniref:hypothetical protein n=1 Tax=Nitrospirillum sp. BR 11828 TaxID=3104325 RepID=UPI002ACA9FE2|nr:hypothetical protein [Nitrospirillum sp. BR 11828]MDZ5647918.1 hypothetical protein [Nitrospirillum sp. BR 11828]
MPDRKPWSRDIHQWRRMSQQWLAAGDPVMAGHDPSDAAAPIIGEGYPVPLMPAPSCGAFIVHPVPAARAA